MQDINKKKRKKTFQGKFLRGKNTFSLKNCSSVKKKQMQIFFLRDLKDNCSYFSKKNIIVLIILKKSIYY